MVKSRLAVRGALILTGLVVLGSCGGGDAPGSSSSSTATVSAASNVVSVVIDGGPTATNDLNTLYTTVTICVPGSTTQCQTIDHIQVDTGSSGLRVLASVLTLSLPLNLASNGDNLLECTQFADGYSWGPIATADLQVSGETASQLPIQVIGDPAFSAIPLDCTGSGQTAEDTVATFGANGLLGISPFEQDCGTTCATNPANTYYYSCTTDGYCVGIEAPVTSQVANPVPLFATDNNGTIITLPAVESPGAVSVTGSLIFGIDTETNNASGTQSILTVDPVYGFFTTVFAGQSLTDSFIDSGSNGIFFNDGSITQCTSFTGFYCPASAESLSATLTGQNGLSTTANFSVGNAETLTSENPTFAVIPELTGTYPSDGLAFDWGLPFFFGRRIATAIEDHSTAVGTGPYFAF